MNRLVEARLGLNHPDLVARDVLRADVDLGDLNEHWTMPCFELNDFGHTNAPTTGWMATNVRSASVRAPARLGRPRP
jgi:hypothetical protein